jgi:hypothetical protein
MEEALKLWRVPDKRAVVSEMGPWSIKKLFLRMDVYFQETK